MAEQKKNPSWKKLKLTQMLDSPLLANAPYIWRYSSSRLSDPENLPTHVYESLVFGVMIIDRMLSLSDEKISMSSFMMKAFTHDLEEVVTGDVPRPLKYSSPEVRKSLQDVASLEAQKMFSENFCSYDSFFFNIWDVAKEGKEGHLLKLVDILTVVKKVRMEVALLGNLSMLPTAKNVHGYLQQLDCDSFYEVFETEGARGYLHTLIHEAQSVLETLTLLGAEVNG